MEKETWEEMIKRINKLTEKDDNFWEHFTIEHAIQDRIEKDLFEE